MENVRSFRHQSLLRSGKADLDCGTIDIVNDLSDKKIVPADGRVSYRQHLRSNRQLVRHRENESELLAKTGMGLEPTTDVSERQLMLADRECFADERFEVLRSQLCEVFRHIGQAFL